MPPLPDIDSLSTLGGNLVNASPVVDPTTDLDGVADTKSRTNVAMMTHTALRSWCLFTAAASTGAMVRVAHDAQWGNASGVAPALARTATGTFTLMYPSTVYDEMGVPHSLNLRAAWGQSRSASAAHDVQVVPTAPNVLTVYVRDSTTGALIDAAGTNFDVFAI